ncbi:MAG TPA: class I SAM-dependent methyltransferase [Vicinamibacterales bacterium]|nr:class I SAM-dependent methyltransferase [Vicinamibacterales bacterium]
MFGPSYDFGYSWLLTRGHLTVAIAFAIVTVLAWRLHWPRWVTVVAGVITVWGLAAAAIVHQGLEKPAALPTPLFLASESGRVLDMGAGSGRATLMVLLARPQATVTALDIYSGYFGIDDNTPERLMANARAAGVDGRVETRTADMRQLPFEDGTFDAALSAFAIDHLPESDIPVALGEAARVLKAGGQFLFMGLNVDVWVRIPFPLPPGHGYWTRSENAARWRGLLTDAGFDVVEDGTQPGTLYVLAQKKP